MVDACFRGANVFLIWTGIEYAAALAPFWPYASFGGLGNIGQLDMGSNNAQTMALTVVANSTTAVGAPNSLQGAGNAIIDENFNGELQFYSGARTPPVTMRLYPYSSGGVRFFAIA